MSNLNKPRTYPKELVDAFLATPKNLIRTHLEQSDQGTPREIFLSDNVNPCFLSEAEHIGAGQEYSFFEINKLAYDIRQSLFSLDASISFPNDCMEIALYADLLDIASNCVISSFALKKIHAHKNLTYDVEQRIAVNTSTDKFAVIVYADWKTSEYAKNSAAIFSYIFKDISFICDHLYPKKEKSYKKFPQNPINTVQNPPNIPALLDKSTRDDYIQIALFRTPDDHKDLDYLCEFGKDRIGQPYMCVPTAFDLILHSGNTKFCTPVKVFCTISSLDPQAGGKYIVASGSTDNITESEVQIDIKPNILHIEMLKQWNTPFPYGGFFHPYDFSYEVIVELTTMTNGQTSTQTVYAISSIKDKSVCLMKIPHISIRWGCLDESTFIKMADGSLCQIKDIHIGDMVACKDGNRQVANMWRGCEDKYIQIITDIQENVSPLLATTDHPILTVNGYKRADEITVGDLLIGESGELKVTSVSLKEQAINICNLSFSDCDHTQAVLANGIYVGDFECQNKS